MSRTVIFPPHLSSLQFVPMKAPAISPAAIPFALVACCLAGCGSTHHEEHHQEAHRIVATTPRSQTVTMTEPYVCQIHSQRHIAVQALERGYLEAILIREGQKVKAGDVLFKVIPVLYQARLDAEKAEAKVAQLEYNYTKQLFEKKVVSENEVALLEAKLAKTRANVELATAELNFATVRAPFDGIIDRLVHQQGSLVEEGEVLTTLSDNSVMWVYFNVPETRYLAYMDIQRHHGPEPKVELMLANGEKFDQIGAIGAIEADFNNATGNIPFRADFANPDRLLRHGQTGTILLSRQEQDAVVIPQRATFEVLDKRYVFVIDDKNIAKQREITVKHELDDIFVISKGVSVEDRIILEGVRQVRDGDLVECEDEPPEQVAGQLKYHAE